MQLVIAGRNLKHGPRRRKRGRACSEIDMLGIAIPLNASYDRFRERGIKTHLGQLCNFILGLALPVPRASMNAQCRPPVEQVGKISGPQV